MASFCCWFLGFRSSWPWFCWICSAICESLSAWKVMVHELGAMLSKWVADYRSSFLWRSLADLAVQWGRLLEGTSKGDAAFGRGLEASGGKLPKRLNTCFVASCTCFTLFYFTSHLVVSKCHIGVFCFHYIVQRLRLLLVWWIHFLTAV